MINDKFIYAAGYYPLMQKKEDWNRDLKIMKDSGINLIRTAELFNTWDRIEPEKGQFNFGFLDEFFDLCLNYDIKILLGSGTASPPYWIHELYPDVNITNNHDEAYPNNVSYSWACIDNKGYLEEIERYLSVLVNRYKDHPSLFAYQLHNEISLPFMPLREGDVDIYCYCNDSIEKFREWIKNKYQTLDTLNYAYRWGATNTVQTRWDQVEPPRTKSTSWSSVTRWLDWRLFWMENMVNFIKWQNTLIKAMDPNHITTTNIFFLKTQDPLGVITALDQFEMAKVVDIIGYDLYPGSGNKLEGKPEFSSMCLDMARSTAESIQKDYWLLETESGPINGWVLGPSRNVKGFDLERNIFEAIGHNAKATLYQGWREWDFQPIHWGAIVDLDGNPTERTEAAGKIGKHLQDESHIINTGHTPKSKIALFLSKENAIILNGMGQEKFLMTALRGAYRIFWEMNYSVDFITPELVENGYANHYEIIFMPFTAYVTKKLAQSFASYVHQGGNLIGTARCGMLGDKGWYNHQNPCFDLVDVFGVEVKEIIANVTPTITYNMKNYKGHWHKEVLAIKETTKILARFSDDQPCVTLNHYGKGQALYFGTHPDVAYIENGSELGYDLIKNFMTTHAIKPKIELEYANPQVKEIDGHLLENDTNALLILTHYINQSHSGFFNNKTKSVRVKLNTIVHYKEAINITTQEKINITYDDNVLNLQLTITKNETLMIKLNK